MALLGTLLRRPKATVVEVEEPTQAAPAGPQLTLLVPSVAGISSYRLHTFADAESAAAFAASSFNAFLRSNIQAFWALHGQPDAATATPAERRGEALVIIREAAGSNVVYALSFVDVESALAFARFEVERGLDPSLLLLYWASLVEILEEPDGVRLQPPCPPRAYSENAALEPPTGPAIADSIEPEPVATPDATHHIEFICPAGDFAASPADRRELRREERAAMEGYRLQEVQGTGLLVEEPPAKCAEPARVTQGATVGAAVPPAAAVTAGLRAPVAPEPPAQAQLLLLAPPAQEGAEEPAGVAEMPTPPAPSVADLDCASGADIAAAAQKLLRQRRWEQRSTPFRGFGSPPGKF